MPDATRLPTDARLAQPADADATVESLLVAGLDLYFAGEYERAIHAWTRVLFVDRGHARARAYIERARLVLAERQRKSDVLLHGAMEAFDAGDTTRARALLDEAVAHGGSEAQALTLMERLARIEPPPGVAAPAATDAPAHRGAAPASPARRVAWPLVLLGTLAVTVAVAWPFVVDWATAVHEPPAPAVVPASGVSAPIPRASDLLIDRARGLFSRGHLHEAAAVLGGIRIDDPRRADADRLLAEIQRVLLSGATPTLVPPPAGEAGARR